MTTAAGTLVLPLAERRWFNAVWFQLTWFCAVLGRENWILVTAAMLTLHLFLVGNWRQELTRLLPLVLIGAGIDGALGASGVYLFDGGVALPAWLACLWLAFSTTMYRSLDWVGRRWWWAALAGGLAMPWNYWAGSKLGAVEFGYDTAVTLALLALIWAVALPAMYALARRLQ